MEQSRSAQCWRSQDHHRHLPRPYPARHQCEWRAGFHHHRQHRHVQRRLLRLWSPHQQRQQCRHRHNQPQRLHRRPRLVGHQWQRNQGSFRTRPRQRSRDPRQRRTDSHRCERLLHLHQSDQRNLHRQRRYGYAAMDHLLPDQGSGCHRQQRQHRHHHQQRRHLHQRPLSRPRLRL